ncbi:MAG: hypothetical protein FJ108_04985 [Deltaproteobacteria bacterium]|nr:hypothetical protein [Deltaproteobacteria bacterium]
MKPEIPNVLEILAGTLLFDVMPNVSPSYRQSSVGVSAMLLGMVREEWDRAAARRSEENAALRALFRESLSAVSDANLRSRLDEATRGGDASLKISDLERDNERLRALLIELHAHVELEPGAPARAVEEAIWRELSASTERRKLALAPF